MPTPQDVREWARICQIPQDQAAELLDLLSGVGAEHRRWQHRRRGGQADLQNDMDTLIRGATRVRNFEPFVIPGLLQTAPYAQSRFEANAQVWGFPAGDVEGSVAARMHRQDVLLEPGRTFELIILDLALRPLLCPPDVMLGQLDRLLSVAGLPGVTLGIVPILPRLPVPPLSGFLLLDDEFVVVETFGSSVRVVAEEAATYVRVMGALRDAALTGDAARRMILNAAEDIRGEFDRP